MCGLLLFLCCQYKCWLLHMNLPRAKARGFHELPEEARVSLSRNPVCTQEQTGSRTYMSEKTAKRNEDNSSLHFHVANFFKFMAANLSFTQFIT